MKTIKNITLFNKIEHTICGNQLLFAIRKMPVLGGIFDNGLYYDSFFTRLLGAFVNFFKYFQKFLIKVIILLLILFTILAFENVITLSTNLILPVLIFITPLIIIFTLPLFKGNNSKYYAVSLFKFDAKKYNFFYSLKDNIINSLIFSVFFFIILGLEVPYLSIFLYFLISYILIENLIMIYYDKKNKIIIDSILFILLLTIIDIGAGVGFHYLFDNLSLNLVYFIDITLLVLLMCTIPWYIKTSAYSVLYNERFGKYKPISNEEKSKEQFKNFEKQNELTKEISTKTSKLTGYSFLNAVFMDRHKKILFNKALHFMIICLLVLAFVVISYIFKIEFVNELLDDFSLSFPAVIILSLLINMNIVDNATKAYFFNCDHSLLKFNFYREKRVVLQMFYKRLSSLIKINFLPNMSYALLLSTICLLYSNNINFLNIITIFLACFFLMLFFNIHCLGCYYLLQPYTENMEFKSTAYKIVSIVTLFVCYEVPDYIKLSFNNFALVAIVFSGIYFVVMLGLINNFASKTFKIRK